MTSRSGSPSLLSSLTQVAGVSRGHLLPIPRFAPGTDLGSTSRGATCSCPLRKPCRCWRKEQEASMLWR